MRKVHIIGAGLSGLATAVRLASQGFELALYEAAPQAGGRCRSYFDATLGLTIDNGNHLLLSGNQAVQSFLGDIGARSQLTGPASAEFAFIDLADGARWRLRPNDGPVPWWILMPNRRVPGTRVSDYLRPLGLLRAPKGTPIKAAMACQGVLYERLWQPFFLAALNTAPEEGDAGLAATLLRETLMKGGAACRPLIAADGLSAAFIEPALARLAAVNASVHFQQRLAGLDIADGRVTRLIFDTEEIAVGGQDQIVLAVPAPVAQSLLPDIVAPQAFRAIVNAHFKFTPPAGLPPLTGVINGLCEWLFVFADRLSVTISAADRLIDVPREELAQKIWQEVARVIGIAAPLPAWQIIKEKRATFAATPAEEARRPGTKTALADLWLAGDWTATGLPATIEGALRSGFRAADHIRLATGNAN